MKKLFIGLPLAILGLVLGLFALALLVLFFVFFAIFGTPTEDDTKIENPQGATCSPSGEINMDSWNSRLENGGVLSDMGDVIIDIAEDKGIDPVLFAAIALFETGNGSSSAVVNFNNPGGLMDPSSGSQELFRYGTLEEGLDAMGSTLRNRIIGDGLTTIDKLGTVYAPIGATNDPHNTNVNWKPSVESISEELGGLTMNCETKDVKFEGDLAWVSPHTTRITSGYGPRSCTGCSDFHKGIDIAEDGINGTPAVALADGEVVESTSNGTTFVSSSTNMGTGFGYYVVVEHEDGMKTRYAHLLQKGSPVGTKVVAGQEVGRIGSTGASSAPHLHFEILINDEAVNPMDYLEDFDL